MKTIKLIPKNVERFKIDMPIPNDIIDINRVFKANGFELFIVGGAVRDFIMDKPIKDFDLATNAMPDDVERILHLAGFKTLGTGKSFGVINVFTDNDEFEIATFREDISNEDGEQGRHPEVKLGTTIESDVKRRDLTLNALFFDIERGEIVDLVGGIEDIRNKVIRTVGSADDRFSEDKLRILRAIRFANRLGVDLHSDIKNSLNNNSSLMGISKERIRDEFIKSIKSAKNVIKLINMLKKFGLLKQILNNMLISHTSVDTKDHVLLLATLLNSNEVDSVSKELNLMTFTKDEINSITFLLSFRLLNNSTAPILKKLQMKTNITNEQIKSFGGLMRMDNLLVDKFLIFNLSISGHDVMRDFNINGKQLGEKIHELEVENFNNI